MGSQLRTANQDCLGCLCSTGSHELGSHFGACCKAKSKQVLKPKRLEEVRTRPSDCESLGQRQRQRSHHRVIILSLQIVLKTKMKACSAVCMCQIAPPSTCTQCVGSGGRSPHNTKLLIQSEEESLSKISKISLRLQPFDIS